MKSETLYQMIEHDVLPQCLAIMKTKGSAYSGLEDKLGNFKRVAASAGVSPLLVWYVYFSKHLDAIASFIRGEYQDSEPIDGRIQDSINYLFLMYGLIHEDDAKSEESTNKPSRPHNNT